MSFNSWLESHITLHSYDDPKEERANAVTHAFGALLSAAALVYALIHISRFDIGFFVYLLSMLLLYSASALYHSLKKGNGKRLCRVLDHANIYILIAGTYTPILTTIGTAASGHLLLLIWFIAAAGTAFTLIFWGRFGFLHVLLYVLMGWMIVFFWGDIIPNIPGGLVRWVFAGGIVYTLGVGFYAAKKLPFYHAIWHLFVLGGSICFFIGFITYLY